MAPESEPRPWIASSISATRACAASARQQRQQLVCAVDERGDLVLIALHPLVPRRADRHEVAVLLPDEQRALGAEHVLLPPDLPQVVLRDAVEGLRRGL